MAHEFGHYLLGHHKESPESSLARNELRVKEIEKFEREANFFARFFLSPPPLIVEAKIDNTQKLMEFFGVSFTSANHTLKYIQDSYKKGFRFKIPSKIENILLPYAKKIIYGKTCVVCNTFFYFKKSSYCPMCGSNELHNFFRGDDFDMFYPGIEVDENSKALSCPVCSNVETLHGDYCNQCGAFLVNVCAGKVVDTDFGDQIISCRISLPGNSRHCHKCGAESSFLQNGFLKKWHKVKKEHQEQERIEAEYEIAIRK
ncbi:ImmA/IrrE family metallo-endopeptidase [Halalkalibacterium halodurans]|uniref:ImmA/IrrE family metallo-endopeptidase n=1 Tax=Halalkalibacterium halodurans TaxID=86665 RepID=UPI002AA9FA5B|nr:ImmA/IrrE family metallo-endopeptidase [Halalkalibacterium halodurans]MDY7223993.1 ImmA/IrrE family metallo-endopeptidase [Halalkalibacterium halodurans]MDY7243214.1 ImmA/IrrE family metallo-endopeptidase [Halalkalibacterium halodurans]